MDELEDLRSKLRKKTDDAWDTLAGMISDIATTPQETSDILYAAVAYAKARAELEVADNQAEEEGLK